MHAETVRQRYSFILDSPAACNTAPKGGELEGFMSVSRSELMLSSKAVLESS
jgi:hypothetical protein